MRTLLLLSTLLMTSLSGCTALEDLQSNDSDDEEPMVFSFELYDKQKKHDGACRGRSAQEYECWQFRFNVTRDNTDLYWPKTARSFPSHTEAHERGAGSVIKTWTVTVGNWVTPTELSSLVFVTVDIHEDDDLREIHLMYNGIVQDRYIHSD